MKTIIGNKAVSSAEDVLKGGNLPREFVSSFSVLRKTLDKARGIAVRTVKSKL